LIGEPLIVSLPLKARCIMGMDIAPIGVFFEMTHRKYINYEAIPKVL